MDHRRFPAAAVVRLYHERCEIESAYFAAGLRASIPDARLWRYTLRPPDTPRYEEQDLDVLLHDLDRSRALQ